MSPSRERRVVCVDLDGTLIVGDLLWESIVRLFKSRPLALPSVVPALLKGRAPFKRRVAALAPVDPARVAYRPELLAHLQQLRVAGASLVLATAADEGPARAIADHLSLFDDVIASDGRTNLKGRAKADRLCARFGQGGFDYVGNDWADVEVWRVAGGVTAVAASPALAQHLEGSSMSARVLSARRSPLRALIRALRPHQWAKNLLVFLPAMGAHTLGQLDAFTASLVTFTAFSFCASAIYILNDILDIEADRLHPRKCTRPFAAGDLSVPAGCVAAAVLLVAALLTVALNGSWPLGVVLLAYVATTSAYSVYLKREPVVDVFTLTALYVVRIVAGGVATGTPLSSWLLGFALFFFLSLAFVKRYTELLTATGGVPGRAYGAEDAPWIHAIGVCSGYMAGVVLALYVNAPDIVALYSRPQVLWSLCPLMLFWITRLWFRASRGLIHDDPVVEALKDWVSYVTLTCIAVTMLVAI